MAAGTWRDRYGVPHVRADSVLELAHEQGRVTAVDRSWQLEYQRRRATGSAAEVLGRRQVGWDTLVRRVRVADTARRAFAALSAQSQAFVTAYVEGVNAGLHPDAPELQTLGIEPTAWQPWTPLAVFHAQHVLFSNLPGKLWHQLAHEVLGPDQRLLSRDPAYGSGSNAWAVGGALTASGLPLVGGDPHRVIEVPGVYQQVRLACAASGDGVDRGFDVLGFTFPGVPGVQHFAHAGEVAWAITNAAADTQDVLRLSRAAVTERWNETIVVRDADPVTIEVLGTDRGPVLWHHDDDLLVLADPATESGVLGFEALLPLLRSRSVEDVDRALEHWVQPVNNVVVADRAGRVRFRNAGLVPARPDANRQGIVDGLDPATAWSGWVDLPGYDIDADGRVVTANERRGPESEPIGTEFAPADRADRLHSLLAGRTDLTTSDFEAMHGDVEIVWASWVSAYVADLDPGAPGARVRQAIVDWDGRAAVDSAGAAACAAWRSALTRRICAEPVFAPLRDPAVVATYGPVLAPSLELAAHVGLALIRLLREGTPFGLDLRRLATLALDDAAGHPATWGETHVLDASHAFDQADDDLEPPRSPRPPVAGDIDTVRCTGWLPGVVDACYRGSVARYVWDLADRDRSGWVVVHGAAGDHRSPHHHDQLDAWTTARLLPVVTDWELLTPDR